MKKNIKVCLIFFTILLLVLIINFSIILNKTGIIEKEKQIQKEMRESTQVSDLQTQINKLIASHTEYANYVQRCKSQLASTISDEGVSTSENDTFEKIVTNIGDIFVQRTKLDESVAATADNISEGKQAYVNGELITGNGKDIEYYYNQGYDKGVSDASLNKTGYDSLKLCTITNTYDSSQKTIDLTSLVDNYSNYTNNSFIIVPTKVGYYGYTYSGGWESMYGTNGGKNTISLSYNNTTGQLTVNGLRAGFSRNNDGFFYYGYIASFDVLLID